MLADIGDLSLSEAKNSGTIEREFWFLLSVV